ncbi:uncharacterized protein [Eleutherodactylus coqui]|uniref:uncharacterized protein isoform X2 n=1 Tax=Eleutherodactylus coqui TaxID=57060 RepID=UPI0034634D9B
MAVPISSSPKKVGRHIKNTNTKKNVTKACKIAQESVKKPLPAQTIMTKLPCLQPAEECKQKKSKKRSKKRRKVKTITGQPASPMEASTGQPTNPEVITDPLSNAVEAITGPLTSPMEAITSQPTSPIEAITGQPASPMEAITGQPTDPEVITDPPSNAVEAVTVPLTSPMEAITIQPTSPIEAITGPPTSPMEAITGPPASSMEVIAGPPTDPQVIPDPPSKAVEAVTDPLTRPVDVISDSPRKNVEIIMDLPTKPEIAVAARSPIKRKHSKMKKSQSRTAKVLMDPPTKQEIFLMEKVFLMLEDTWTRALKVDLKMPMNVLLGLFFFIGMYPNCSDCTFVEKGLMMTDQHPNGNQNGSQPSVKEAIKTETLEDVTPARTDHDGLRCMTSVRVSDCPVILHHNDETFRLPDHLFCPSAKHIFGSCSACFDRGYLNISCPAVLPGVIQVESGKGNGQTNLLTMTAKDCAFVEKGLMMTDERPNGNQNGNQPAVMGASKTGKSEDMTPARTKNGTDNRSAVGGAAQVQDTNQAPSTNVYKGEDSYIE